MQGVNQCQRLLFSQLHNQSLYTLFGARDLARVRGVVGIATEEQVEMGIERTMAPIASSFVDSRSRDRVRSGSTPRCHLL